MFYKYVYNILWEHFVKFEMDLMKINMQRHFKNNVNNVFIT